MDFKCFNGIFRAAGIIPAGFGKGRGNDPLVDFYGHSQKANKQPPDPPDQEEIVDTF
jgi:hypothetical protein